MCPEGGHSVLHSFMREMPLGDCTVTKKTYDPGHPTVCGEIRVCQELLYRALPEGHKLYAWRTPFLNTPDDQWKILYSEGVLFDASLGLGDLKSNFPIYLKTYPQQQDWFRGLPMFEYVMTIEDGFGMIKDGQIFREELKAEHPAQVPRHMEIRHPPKRSKWSVDDFACTSFVWQRLWL